MPRPRHSKNVIKVEMTAAAFEAVKEVRVIAIAMGEPLETATLIADGEYVALKGDRYIFEQIAGELTHEVNHAPRWTNRIELLNEATEAIEVALAEAGHHL